MGDNLLHDEDIFYSDEDYSDSEEISFKTPDYFSIFQPDRRLKQNSSSSCSPESDNSRSWGTIDRPITQISMGIQGLGFGGGLFHHAKISAPVTVPKVLSYSTMAKKEPLQPLQVQKTNIIRPKIITKTTEPLTKIMKVAETAVMAGYRFRASNPLHDPRYPGDQQLMVGPIPGTIDHDVIYNGLRSVFQARGTVCFMFLHKSAVKDNDNGDLVKFGYVVFAEKGIAQKVLQEEKITFNGGIKINVQAML